MEIILNKLSIISLSICCTIHPNYGDMVTLFHKCMHIFLYIVSCTSVVFYYPQQKQQLFLGSGGKWQCFPQHDKEMVTRWDTKAMWRIFVYMHMVVWVVLYEVNYLNSFRQFPEGSVSGYCFTFHCCPWSQSYEDCLRISFYRILHHNVKRNIYPAAEKKCFPFFFFFFFFLLLLLMLFFFLDKKKEEKKCFAYLPYCFFFFVFFFFFHSER